jgi:hypothetical protein
MSSVLEKLSDSIKNLTLDNGTIVPNLLGRAIK